MAIINKTGITNGSTIQSEHITRVIDALSGASTDTLILSGSMTGSLIGVLTGTASFATSASRAVSSSFAISSSRAVSSSFAATASYALNADSSGEYVTLNFIHTARTGTTSGTKTAFGTFPVGVNSESRIAAVTPFNCIIVSASLSTHCSTPGSTAKVGYDLVWYNGATNVSQSFGIVDLVNFIPTTLTEHRQFVGASMDAGRNIYIKMTDGTTDASVVYSSHMAVLLKKV